MKIFLYSSSVYPCHLFLISSASVRPIPFLSFIEPIFAWNIPLVSLIFLKRSLVFPILFTWQVKFASGLPGGSVVKDLPANAGDARDTGSTSGLERSPGGGHGNPLQYSCWDNRMDRGTCWARIHGVAQSAHDWECTQSLHCLEACLQRKGWTLPPPQGSLWCPFGVAVWIWPL